MLGPAECAGTTALRRSCWTVRSVARDPLDGEMPPRAILVEAGADRRDLLDLLGRERVPHGELGREPLAGERLARCVLPSLETVEILRSDGATRDA